MHDLDLDISIVRFVTQSLKLITLSNKLSSESPVDKSTALQSVGRLPLWLDDDTVQGLYKIEPSKQNAITCFT